MGRVVKAAGIAVATGAVLVGVFLLGMALNTFRLPAPVAVTTENSNTQVISSIAREEQVVLLGLGIQGLSERSTTGTVFGIEVPGSKRATFLQYNFNAKLGIEGKDVEIVKTGDNSYLISIPEFIFIGHSGVSFKLAAEDNGALSWVTPEIDTTEMINAILNDETQRQYIASNRQILQDQAEAFYSGIVSSVDPTTTVRFEYRN